MSPATAITRRSVSCQLGDAIRPFHVNFPEEALVDLRRRIATTRLALQSAES